MEELIRMMTTPLFKQDRILLIVAQLVGMHSGNDMLNRRSRPVVPIGSDTLQPGELSKHLNRQRRIPPLKMRISIELRTGLYEKSMEQRRATAGSAANEHRMHTGK
jgi:hypothetical protein